MAQEDKTETTKSPEQQDAGAAVQVHAQYIKDFSFENPNSPESLLAGWGAPDTNVQINIRHQNLQDNTHEVVLLFRIEAKNKEADKVTFIVELAYAATVSLNGVPEENQHPVLMVEVPKLLFPFAREIIADAAIKGGYPPLYLQPVSFEAIYMGEMQRLQAENAGKEGDAEKASA